MSTLTITIPGKPMGKQRARATRGGRMYTPSETVNAESFAKSCAYEQVGQPMLEGALNLIMEVRCEVPKSWSKKKTEAALSGAIRPTGKPDLDNLVKLYADAFNGVVWGDDAQIVNMSLSKQYSSEPSTTIHVTQTVLS